MYALCELPGWGGGELDEKKVKGRKGCQLHYEEVKRVSPPTKKSISIGALR